MSEYINPELSEEKKKDLFNSQYLERKSRVKKWNKLTKQEKCNSLNMFPSGAVSIDSTTRYYKDNEGLE